MTLAQYSLEKRLIAWFFHLIMTEHETHVNVSQVQQKTYKFKSKSNNLTILSDSTYILWFCFFDLLLENKDNICNLLHACLCIKSIQQRGLPQEKRDFPFRTDICQLPHHHNPPPLHSHTYITGSILLN